MDPLQKRSEQLTEEDPKTEIVPLPSTWIGRVKSQGPWNQQRTPKELQGAPSLPMPVSIASPESLFPCFDHISKNGTHLPLLNGGHQYKLDTEQHYGIPYIEFEKGVIYEDRRVDLCKMVLGPTNIDGLLDSLEENEFIEHFLLGNNIIGPAGCRRIGRFLKDHPDRMDTWYLAGNCIDAKGFDRMAANLAESKATNIWLKRNPLGPESVRNLELLIKTSKSLRTLDLDQTELGDDGVTQLFDALHSHDSPEPYTIQHLYMNAIGIGPQAAASINRFLLSPLCKLKSLYLSNNPLGDDGVTALCQGLGQNATLERLMLSSVGMTTFGAKRVFTSLKGHSTLMTFDVAQSYATKDLGAHFNHIGDGATEAISDFIRLTPNLRLLDLSYTALSYKSIQEIVVYGVLRSASLCSFPISTIIDLGPASSQASEAEKEEQKARTGLKRLQTRIKKRLEVNIEEFYPDMSLENFHNDELRWLKGPKEDLRKIDSVYRNRDAGLARRGLKILEKWWSDGDDTLDEVMAS